MLAVALALGLSAAPAAAALRFDCRLHVNKTTARMARAKLEMIDARCVAIEGVGKWVSPGRRVPFWQAEIGPNSDATFSVALSDDAPCNEGNGYVAFSMTPPAARDDTSRIELHAVFDREDEPRLEFAGPLDPAAVQLECRMSEDAGAPAPGMPN